jgi:hypothetical protein
MKVQMVTPYRVSHWQRYGVTVRGKVRSAYPPLDFVLVTRFYGSTLKQGSCAIRAYRGFLQCVKSPAGALPLRLLMFPII